MKGLFLLLLFLSALSSWARMPCDGDMNLELGLTTPEKRLMGLVDELYYGKQPATNKIPQISDELSAYLKQSEITFTEERILITKEDFGFIPKQFGGEDLEATLYVLDNANPLVAKVADEFSGMKLYYIPEAEFMRLGDHSRILKYKDGLVLSLKDLYYFNHQNVVARIQDRLQKPMESYADIPDLTEAVLFKQYIGDVRRHLEQSGIKFIESGEGIDVSFRIMPEAKASTLNSLSAKIKEKFDGTTLLFHPLQTKKNNASGMFNSKDNVVYISHRSVLTAKVDFVVVHELMHAYMHNVLLKNFKFSPFHGSLLAQTGMEMSGLSAYKKYMHFEEVATHSLNVHMGAKNLMGNMEGTTASLKQMSEFRVTVTRAHEIAKKAAEAMDAGIQQVDQLSDGLTLLNPGWLKGDKGKGFILEISANDFKGSLPLYFRNEASEITEIAVKYNKEGSIVSLTDMKKLKPYLKSILEERKALYDEVANSHRELLALLQNRKSNLMGFNFKEEEIKLIMAKAGKGRTTCLGADFEKAPEVQLVERSFWGFLGF